MIYNDEFVWLHFPKCAGSKVELLFAEYFSGIPGLVQDPFSSKADPSISWHDSIAKRKARDPRFRLGDRRIICSFRTLPAWLESRYNYEVSRNPGLPHRPELLLEGRFLEASGREISADFYARTYAPGHLVLSGQFQFLRVEFFESDFRAQFGRFLDVERIPRGRMAGKVNYAENRFVPPEISEELHSADRSVYGHCPHWRRCEELAFDGYVSSA